MNNDRVNNLIIHTPEGCRFSLPLAGPFSRFLAWLIDMLVIIALIYGAIRLIMILQVISADLAGFFTYLAIFGISMTYGVLLEWFWRGRTVGKRLFRLRVIDEQGLPLTFSQVLIRNLLRFVDMMPQFYLVGGVSCMLTRRAQRLGDLAAGTVVVRTPRVKLPNVAPLIGDKYNSFRRYPHIEARLRQRVSPQEAHILVQALLRRDKLDPEARVAFFSRLVEHFRSIVAFPPEAVEGLSDERYAQNLAETLFRTHLTAAKT